MKNSKLNANLRTKNFYFVLLSLLMALLFPICANCNDVKNYSVSLPKGTEGIEKLEYSINDVPQGSVYGTDNIMVQSGSRITFFLKFNSQGYSNLYVKDVKIISTQGNFTSSTLNLNTYSYDDNGSFVLMKVPDDTLIDPNQTYVSSDCIVSSDTRLYVKGITKNTYTTKITSDSEGIELNKALDVRYSFDGNSYSSMEYLQSENSFLINNVEFGTSTSIILNKNSGYEQSDIEVYCGSEKLSFQPTSGSFILPEIYENQEIVIHGLQKNRYNLSFSNTESTEFRFRNLSSGGDFIPSTDENITALYGDTIQFKCNFSDDNFLSSNEVTVNGLTVSPVNGVYTIKNISQDCHISTSSKSSALYPVSLGENEHRVYITDTSGNSIQSLSTRSGEQIEFKILPNAGYTKKFIFSSIYAVPTSKINDDYNVNANLDDAKSYLLVPSADGIYTIGSVTEPITLVVTNLELNTYEIVMPDAIEGATAQLQMKDDIKYLGENKFEVPHGTDIEINVTAKEGYNISNLSITDTLNNPLAEKLEDGKFVIKNVSSDNYLIIQGATVSMCDIKINNNGVIAKDSVGAIFNNNEYQIEYDTGVVQFKLEPAQNCTISDLGLSLTIESGRGILSAAPDSDGYYTLSNVTTDITVGVDGVIFPETRVILQSDDDDIVYTNADTGEVLPNEITTDYGSTLNLTVSSLSGKSIDNDTLTNDSNSSLTNSDTSSDTYSLNTRGVTTLSLRSSPMLLGATNSRYKANASLSVSLYSEFQSAFESVEVSCDNTLLDYNAQTNILTLPRQYYQVNYGLNAQYGGEKKHKVGSSYYHDYDYEYEYTYNYTFKEETNNLINGARIKYKLKLKDEYTFVKDITSGWISTSNILTPFSLTIQDQKLVRDSDGTDSLEFVVFVKRGKGPDVTGGSVTSTNRYYYDDDLNNRLYYYIDNNYLPGPTTLPTVPDITLSIMTNRSAIKKSPVNVSFGSDTSVFQVGGASLTNYTAYMYRGFEFNSSPKSGYELKEDLKLSNESVSEDPINFYKIINSIGSDSGASNNDSAVPTMKTESPWLWLRGVNLLIKGYIKSGAMGYKIASKNDVIDNKVSDVKELVTNGDGTYTFKNVVVDSERCTLSIEGENNTKKVYDGLMNSLLIESQRELLDINLTFNYSEGIKYYYYNENGMRVEITDSNRFAVRKYGDTARFELEALPGYDASDIQVYFQSNNVNYALVMMNTGYFIPNMTSDISVSVVGTKRQSVPLTFTQYSGISYENSSGEPYSYSQYVTSDSDVSFQIEFSESYSDCSDRIKVYAKIGEDTNEVIEFKNKGNQESGMPYVDGGLYIIPQELINKPIVVSVEGVEINKYNVDFQNSGGFKFYRKNAVEEISESDKLVSHGGSLSFVLKADAGYDLSDVEVTAKKGTDSSVKSIDPANGIYTLENIDSDYQIVVLGVSKIYHQVDIRASTGVSCIDDFGNAIPDSLSVSDGESVKFFLSFDRAYSRSVSTVIVSIKGTSNTLSPDSNGMYTLDNIKENKIIEILNVVKDSYTVTFAETEGVVYRTAKGKVFSGVQEIEYGQSLYFQVVLLDAYDQSNPSVLLNGNDRLIKNSGVYKLENITDDVKITVEDVEMNSEEASMNNIQNMPTDIEQTSDVNDVVSATKEYNSLSDEEKGLVTNARRLEEAQNAVSSVVHNSAAGVKISGVDWNIMLVVTPLSDDEKEMNTFSDKVERKDLLSLYKVDLVDLLTEEICDIPYGSTAKLELPIPNLDGYKNVAIAHENTAGSMEYIDADIVDNRATIEITSTGYFGVAAKKIPQYTDNTADVSISVSGLVDDDDELKSVLSDDLVSKLGTMIDDEDESDYELYSSNNETSKSSSGSKGSSDGESNNESKDRSTNSLANALSEKIENIGSSVSEMKDNTFKWAIDNEFWTVVIVLVLGFSAIGLILVINNKKSGKSK